MSNWIQSGDGDTIRAKTDAEMLAEIRTLRNAAVLQADEIERLREILGAVDYTLSIHGKIDAETPLHERVRAATLTPKQGWDR